MPLCCALLSSVHLECVTAEGTNACVAPESGTCSAMGPVGRLAWEGEVESTQG